VELGEYFSGTKNAEAARQAGAVLESPTRAIFRICINIVLKTPFGL